MSPLKPRSWTDDHHDGDAEEQNATTLSPPVLCAAWAMAVLLICLAAVVAIAQERPPAQALRSGAAELDGVQLRMLSAAAALDEQAATIAALRRDVEKLREMVGQLQTQLPVPPAPVPVAARVNLYAAPTWSGAMGRAQLWTDVTAYTASEYTAFMVAAARPPGGVGTYLSSCDVVDPSVVNRYPAQTITSDRIPAEWRTPSNFNQPGRWTVDLRNPAAAAKIGDEIVAEFKRRALAHGVNVLYLDNVAHPESGDRRFTWSERMAALEYIRARLPESARLIVNVTLPPGLWPNVDLQRVARCVNGVTFEIAMHPSYRDAPHKVAAVIADVREFARRDVAVIFSLARNSAWDAAAYAREKQFAAALALLCRERSDSPVYAVPGSQPPENPAWMAWAEQAGRPTGDATEHGNVWQRPYTGGVVRLRPASGEGEFEPAR
jgi:hypothetical protein